MPKPIQLASSFVGPNELPAETQAGLLRFAAAFGRAGNARHAGHVLSVVAPSIDGLVKHVAAPAGCLAYETESMNSILATVADRSRGSAHPLAPTTSLTFWDCVAVLDLGRLDAELLRLVGAMAHQLLQKPGSITQDALRALWQVAFALGTEAQAGAMAVLRGLAGSILDRSAKQLRPLTSSRASAAATAEEASLEREWRNALSYSDEKAIPGRRRAVEISVPEVVNGCMAVRQAAEAGNPWAIVVAVAVWIGISVLHVLRLGLLRPHGRGLIRIDRSNRFVQVDLSGVLASLAQKSTEHAKPTSDVLRLPLPCWLSSILSALRVAAPQADNLETALKLSARRAPARVSGLVENQVVSVSVAGLIKSRSLVLFGKVDQLVLVFGGLDFARTEKSTPHYRTIAHAEIAAYAAARALAYRWGEVCQSEIPSGQCIGSRMTPEDEMVLRLVAERRRVLATARCGPNAGWELLRKLFNGLVLYTLLMVTVVFLIRGVTSYGLKASMLKYFLGTDWTDKRVGGGEGVSQQFFAGATLQRQFSFLAATAEVILDRAERLRRRGQEVPQHAIAHLEALLSGDEDALLLCLIEPEAIRPCGHEDLIAGLELEWPFRRDALRHAEADGYAVVTRDTAMVELILRHLTMLCRLRTDSTVLSVDIWRIDAGHAQDALLARLGLLAEPGLVKRLKPRRPNV